MVVLHLPPYSPLHALSSLQLLPFRDAGYSIANYPLYHSDVIFGLNRALCVPSTVTDRSVTYVEDEAPGVEPVEKVVNVGPPKGGLGGPLLDLATFNVEEYERYETVEEGDWNWLVKQTWYKDVGDESRPGSPSSPSSLVDGGRPRLEKRYAGFIAFASPKEDDITSLGSPRSTSSDSCYHYYENAPNTSRARRAAGKRLNKAFWNVLNCFENNGVKLVIRLNRVQYPKEWFTELGIEHRESELTAMESHRIGKLTSDLLAAS
jgi:cell division cycle 14